MKTISELSIIDRPREKLQAKGPSALSDVELLAVLLGSGGRNNDVVTLSKRILAVVDNRNGDLCFEDLASLSGIGAAKASQVLAAIEFSRRRIRPDNVKVRLPIDVLPLIQHYADRKQEHFICISLNGAHEVIATRVISVGLVNRTQVHPREVYADAITDRAAAIIVAHNHPSGDTTPSEEDKKVTDILTKSGQLLGIPLLDHIILGKRGYYSFCETGKL